MLNTAGQVRYEPSLAQNAGLNGVKGPVAEAILCGTKDKTLPRGMRDLFPNGKNHNLSEARGFDENLRRSEDSELT